MNKIKELKELRNAKLVEAHKLVTSAQTETRSLNEQEDAQFKKLTEEVRAIDEQIKNEKELRSLNGEDKQLEEPKMENTQELEVRGLEQYLRKQDGEEKRALVVTADGSAVIPELVEGNIIKKMEETSPVFAKARKFPSTSGNLKIAKETATSAAGFVGEGQDVAEGAVSLGDVTLTQKRVGAAISLSNQFINDSAVNIVDYSVELLARRTAKAIEKSILVGTVADEFKGIKGTAGVAEVEVAAGAITVDTLMDVYNAVHPEFLNGAEWVMSRAIFNQVSKLKDGNGHFYMQNGVINGRLTYTLLGAPVNVTDALDAGAADGEVPILFINVEQAYAVMIKKGLELKHITADTTQAMRGSQLLVLDGYMDGAVYNEQAVARVKVTAGA